MNKTEQHTHPDDLIIAYLNGELNKEQQQSLEEWIAADTSHKRYFYEATEIWLSAVAASDKVGNKEQAYLNFKGRLDEARKSKIFSLRWVRVAAAVFIGVFLLNTTFYLGNEYGNRTLEKQAQTIEVPAGSKSRIILPDGTVVWLNAGSKFSYRADFAQKKREVKLEGEGYFEVTPDTDHPFIVNTSHIDVKVFGTKFSVKAYEKEQNVVVLLAEGSVKFINKDDLQASFMMIPEQQAVYNKETGKTALSQVPASAASDWTTGAHFFNELTLEQIANILEKSYDVTFIFRKEEKKNLTFYGDFRSDDTLDDILTIMSSSGKFKYRKTRNIIEVY